MTSWEKFLWQVSSSTLPGLQSEACTRLFSSGQQNGPVEEPSSSFLANFYTNPFLSFGQRWLQPIMGPKMRPLLIAVKWIIRGKVDLHQSLSRTLIYYIILTASHSLSFLSRQEHVGHEMLHELKKLEKLQTQNSHIQVLFIKVWIQYCVGLHGCKRRLKTQADLTQLIKISSL